MKNLQTFKVDESQTGQRLDRFLVAVGLDMSRSKLKGLIDSGQVQVNSMIAKPSRQLEVGDVVVLNLPAASEWISPLEPVNMSLDILFEDEDVIVINKPAGLVVHPGAGTTEPTLAHGLLAHCQSLGTVAKKDDVTLRPGIVHRLDKDTTGVIVCAKNEKAHANLSAQFKAKTNKREYVGLISGVPTQKVFTVNSYLGRHPTHRTKFISRSAEEIENSESLRNNFRHAVTNIKVQDVFGHRLSFCNIQLQTGRTHQIRVHLSSVGFPIVGDYLYGSKIHLPISFPEVVRKALAQVTRQMLHANLLGFTHPTTGIAVEFRADLPQDFFEVLKILEPYKIT